MFLYFTPPKTDKQCFHSLKKVLKISLLSDMNFWDSCNFALNRELFTYVSSDPICHLSAGTQNKSCTIFLRKIWLWSHSNYFKFLENLELFHNYEKYIYIYPTVVKAMSNFGWWNIFLKKHQILFLIKLMNNY